MSEWCLVLRITTDIFTKTEIIYYIIVIDSERKKISSLNRRSREIRNIKQIPNYEQNKSKSFFLFLLILMSEIFFRKGKFAA